MVAEVCAHTLRRTHVVGGRPVAVMGAEERFWIPGLALGVRAGIGVALRSIPPAYQDPSVASQDPG